MNLYPTNTRAGATVLGALRYYQQHLAKLARYHGEPAGEHLDADILDIVSMGGELDELTAAEIDDLCERLNMGGAVYLPGETPPNVYVVKGCDRFGPTQRWLAFYDQAAADAQALAWVREMDTEGAATAAETWQDALRLLNLAQIADYMGIEPSAVSEADLESYREERESVSEVWIEVAPAADLPPVAAILAHLDAKALGWSSFQAPEGEDNHSHDEEEADTVIEVLGEVRAFICGAPQPNQTATVLMKIGDAPGVTDTVLFEVEGVGQWTLTDASYAQDEGWTLTQYSDGQLCIVADDDRDVFTGERANLDAHAHVEEVAKSGMYQGERAPGYVEVCRRALQLAEATIPLPVFAVELIADGINITAEDEGEARRYALSDAREFMAENTYRLGSVEPSEDEPMEAHEVLVEIVNLVEPDPHKLPEPGPVTRDWCADAKVSVVVEAADRPAAVAAAFDLMGVPLNSNRAAIIAAVMEAEARASQVEG